MLKKIKKTSIAYKPSNLHSFVSNLGYSLIIIAPT